MAARWLREGGAWGERESEGEQEVGRERGMKEGVVRCLQHIPWSGRTQCLPANVCHWASFLYRTPSLLIIIYPWFNIGHTHTHTNRHTREHIHTQCSSFSLHPPTPHMHWIYFIFITVMVTVPHFHDLGTLTNPELRDFEQFSCTRAPEHTFKQEAHPWEQDWTHRHKCVLVRELLPEGHETGCVLSDRDITGQRAPHIMCKRAVRSI